MIEGMVDIGADVTPNSPKLWPVDWPLQEVDIQFQVSGTLSQIKQSTRWLKCIGPEGQVGKLRPCVADTAISLWQRDLLQQWKMGNVLCLRRGYAYVSTGKENLWVPSKLIKIRHDKGKPPEDLGDREEKGN